MEQVLCWLVILFSNDPSSNELLPAFSNSDEAKGTEVETFGQKNSEGNSVIIDYERTYEAQLKEALDTDCRRRRCNGCCECGCNREKSV